MGKYICVNLCSSSLFITGTSRVNASFTKMNLHAQVAWDVRVVGRFQILRVLWHGADSLHC